MMTNFANPNAYPVEGRGVTYSLAFFSAKHLGTGQYYLMTIRDKDRKPFDGSGTYRLTCRPMRRSSSTGRRRPMTAPPMR